MAQPGFALFARMQAISPAFSALYDAAPKVIRSCEPHASTDTFVLRDKCPCTYSYWYIYQYVISSTEPREQAVSTAAAMQTSEVLSFRETNSARVRILILVVIGSTSTSSIHSSSSSANIRNVWSTCGIRRIALPYTTRQVLSF